jgi:hypothetical protein
MHAVDNEECLFVSISDLLARKLLRYPNVFPTCTNLCANGQAGRPSFTSVEEILSGIDQSFGKRV